jgi:Ion channel
MTQAPPDRRAASSGDRAGPPEHGGRYGLLLLLLIFTYLLSASDFSTLAEDVQTVLFMGLLLLALRTAMVSRRIARIAAAVALVGSAAATAAALTHTPAGDGTADLWKGLLLLLAAVLIVRRVLAKPTVTVQSIFGAISAYMIIGLMFAAFYAAIWRLGGGSFFAGQQTAEHQTNTQTIQYFSFTTLTTLGYGDFTAASDGGRAVAVIEALIGQVFLATLVARLVAAFRAPAGQASQTVSRRRPPKAVRRGPTMSYRRRPAGISSRPPARASSAQAAQRPDSDDRAPGPGQ